MKAFQEETVILNVLKHFPFCLTNFLLKSLIFSYSTDNTEQCAFLKKQTTGAENHITFVCESSNRLFY